MGDFSFSFQAEFACNMQFKHFHAVFLFSGIHLVKFGNCLFSGSNKPQEQLNKFT